MTATSKASTRKVDVALGSRMLKELIIVAPWISNPMEKPAMPMSAPNRLVTILEPTAGPTQADRLLPATIMVATKTKTTSAIDSSTIVSHLRMEVTMETIMSARSSQLSNRSSHLCNISL